MQKLTLTSLTTIIQFGYSGANCVTSAGGGRGTASNSVDLHYGDSELKVTPRLVKVRRSGEIVFRLKPNKRQNDPVDYETVNVVVTGKTPAGSWITGSSTFEADPKIVVPVPAGQAYAVYEYRVEIAQVGTLDPRAEVEL